MEPQQRTGVERHYHIQDKKAVLNILRDAPYLEKILLDIPQVIMGIFQQYEGLWLFRDGDELVVSIKTSLDVEEALKALRRFDETWWFGQLDQTQGRLTVTFALT